MTTSVLWLTVPVWWTLILSGALAQGTAKLYDNLFVKNSNSSKAKLETCTIDLAIQSRLNKMYLAWREVHGLRDVLVHDCTALYNNTVTMPCLKRS